MEVDMMVADTAVEAAGMPVAEIGTAVAGTAAVQIGTPVEAAGMLMAEIGTAVGGMVAVWHRSGHGGGWGVGPAIGLGVGLGLLGGALATAPYYGGYDYGYDFAPYADPPAPTVWYWCDPYQGYYPAVPECPVPWRQIIQ
jgi:hypothetical protein